MGTVGRWEISPNAVNSVPRAAALEIDVRDIDASRRDKLVADILEQAKEIAERRKVGFDCWEMKSNFMRSQSQILSIFTVHSADFS